MGRISLEAFRRDLSTRPENPSSAMTVGHTFTFPQRVSPGLCQSFRPKKRGRRECRVLAAPAVSCAKCARSAHTSIQVQSEHSGIPCAVVLRLMPCSPRRRIPLASVIGELTALAPPGRASQRLRRLDASHGRQDHTVLPYAARLRQRPRRVWYPSAEALAKADSASFVCRAAIAHGPKPALPSASRNRRCRVHRIPSPTSVTIAIRPSWRAGTLRL
jgi:hypothetical protein